MSTGMDSYALPAEETERFRLRGRGVLPAVLSESESGFARLEAGDIAAGPLNPVVYRRSA